MAMLSPGLSTSEMAQFNRMSDSNPIPSDTENIIVNLSPPSPFLDGN